MVWPTVHENAVVTKEMNGALKAAWVQLKKLELKPREIEECVGIIFFVPQVLKKKAKKNKNLLSPATTLKAVRELEPTFHAWCFPANKRKEMSWVDYKYKKTEKVSRYLRPGVVAAMFSYQRMNEMFANEPTHRMEPHS